MKSFRAYGIIGYPYEEYGITSSKYRRELKKAMHNNKEKKIKIYINSPGGSVYHGMNMYVETMIASEEGFDIDFCITGMAASMASMIPFAGDRLGSYEASSYMMHLPSTVSWGNEDDLDRELRMLKVYKKISSGVYVKRFKDKTEEEINQMMKTTSWFTARELKDAGVFDYIVENKSAEKIKLPKDVNSLYNEAEMKLMPVAAINLLQHDSKNSIMPTNIVDLTQLTTKQMEERIWMKFMNC